MPLKTGIPVLQAGRMSIHQRIAVVVACLHLCDCLLC